MLKDRLVFTQNLHIPHANPSKGSVERQFWVVRVVSCPTGGAPAPGPPHRPDVGEERAPSPP